MSSAPLNTIVDLGRAPSIDAQDEKPSRWASSELHVIKPWFPC